MMDNIKIATSKVLFIVNSYFYLIHSLKHQTKFNASKYVALQKHTK